MPGVRLSYWLLLCGTLFVPPGVHGESVFIIDQVEAGLHESRSADSPILKILPTGTRLEVLARDGIRVQVRDASETVGWIDERFLMPEKPTRQLLNETESELVKAQAENQKLREQLAASDGRVEPAELQKLRQARDRLQTELAGAREQIADLRSRVNKREAGTENEQVSVFDHASRWIDPILRTPWYLAATAAVLLLLGLLLGVWLMDTMNRRRHGGFRI